MSKSILVSIEDAVKGISWNTPKQHEKALVLCTSIFNLYTNSKTSLKDYLSLSSKYFQTILPSKRDYVIKKMLVESGVLEIDNSYSVNKGVGKGYRFRSTVWGTVSNSNLSSTPQSFKAISYLFPHHQTVRCVDLPSSSPLSLIPAFMQRLTIEENVDDLINKLTNIEISDLVINQNIDPEFVDVVIDKEARRFKRDNAIKFAKQNGLSLIQYKGSFYFDTIDRFIKEKSLQLNICYKQQIFNLREKNFYCDRNDTNNRLDYNLTGLKKELFKKIRFDGEELVELDVANAQFAIACCLNTSLDTNFTNIVSTGKLYSTIEKELGLKDGEGKDVMFRIAFDKIKTGGDFDVIRTMFPKFMTWVDSIKSELGYKRFSNILQCKESEIMIDGLFTHLYEKGYEVFPIHDAIRVKKSQAIRVKNVTEKYFQSIGFDCMVRDKEVLSLPEVIEYNYHGFYIKFTRPTEEDKKQFMALAKFIYSEYPDCDIIHFEHHIRRILDQNKQYQHWYLLDKFMSNKSKYLRQLQQKR